MEKTRIALDKARRHRDVLRRARPNGLNYDVGVNPSSIEYNATRVVQPDFEELRRRLLVAADPDDSRADIYRMLRTQVFRKMRGQKHFVLGVCSSNHGEGKTLVAANLALTIAMDPGRTALLVDLDLRRPVLHDYFGFKPQVGLDDYLKGEATLSDCLVNPGIRRLVLLPVHRPIVRSSEYLVSPMMQDLAADLRGRYPDRIIILDMPPVLATDDCLVALRYVDATLLIVEEGKTKREEIAYAQELLQEGNLIGTVLNKSRQDDGHEAA